MKVASVFVCGLMACLATLLSAAAGGGDETPRTGPETERRFPPLKVPPGFKATLFACDPLVEYPSAAAAGPRAGAIFVAIDYVSGLGTEIVRRDEIRLLEDLDDDGYADRATVYASGFNSIQGLACHDGTVFVMHAPFLSSLRDDDNDGVAEVRRDLLTGLGLPPEKNPSRLHCANGVVVGHDGWLYLALGDNGCDVRRPEGDQLVLQGGGILRCRADGRDLHVFATGLRNIYDVALDEDLNVFVRDNENDGGDYLIRINHSFFSADHGYPYLYAERPDEALPSLAIFGRGSSAGGLCYLETGFPAEYRGDLFFCEWGRAVMRSRPERSGTSFAPLEQFDFASGGENDPYGFKPTDLVAQRDGSLIVTDWADGQQPKRGRGRIYRIVATEPSQKGGVQGSPGTSLESWIAQLDSASYAERCDAQARIEHIGRQALGTVRDALRQRQLGVRGRLHAVWIVAHLGGQAAVDDLVELVRTDPEPRVQAQAVRAVADLADPVLSQHRLAAGPGDPELAARLAALADGRDQRVVRELVIALGRLRWPDAPAWLRRSLTKPDAALAHAAMQTMRRSANWPGVLALLDEPDAEPMRTLALQALADRAQSDVVDGLIDRLGTERDPARRRQYADALARVYKTPGKWVYWGYRPAPRPANTLAWERTEAIEQALDRVLIDPDHAVRLTALKRMLREKVATRLPTLDHWLRAEHEPASVATILEAFDNHPAGKRREPLEAVIADRSHTEANRLKAVSLWWGGGDEATEERLLELSGALEDGPVLAELIRHISKRSMPQASALLLRKLSSPAPCVRTAAVEVAATQHVESAGDRIRELLSDRDQEVRRAAAAAAGTLGIRTAIEPLLELASDEDIAVRRASLDALRRLREPRVVPLAVAALTDRDTQVTALTCIGELGGPSQSEAVVDMAKRSATADVLSLAVRTLTEWSHENALSSAQRRALNQAIAEVQGATGLMVRWEVAGPLTRETAASVVAQAGSPGQLFEPPPGKQAIWRTLFATGIEARLRANAEAGSNAESVWLGSTDFTLTEPATVQFLASSNDTLRIWANGKLVHERTKKHTFQPDSDRFQVDLGQGPNRMLLEVGSSPQAVEFHLRFRRKSSTAEHEQLVELALTRTGNSERGREVFDNLEKSLCLKCHRVGDRGERIGPELTGIGGKFSRIAIIESILEPSRTVAPGFETVTMALTDGRVMTGVRVAETELSLTLADQQGEKFTIAKADIEERKAQPLSTMPDGLEKQLKPEEFVDLIAYLVSQK